MHTHESPWPSIKIDGEWEADGKGPDMDLERRVAYGLMHVPANAFTQDDVDLSEFRVIPTDDGWLVMMKGTRRGRKLIAFHHAATWRAALRATTTMLDSGHTPWRLESPPPWLR